jgi:flagellar hook-associated protein 2
MSTGGIYGLSGSGMDIDSMVKTAMKGKQAQYDKMYKKETKNEWIKSEYNDFYTSMTTFKYSTLSTYKMQSNMSAMGAVSSDAKIATVTANGEAAAMAHKVTVNALSSNAYLQTTTAGITRDNTSAKNSIYLKDIMQSAILSPTAATGATGGIKSYDSNTDIMTFNDGTTLESASKTAAISFNVKDSSTSTSATSYTTTTTDSSGTTISGFIPPAVGSTGSYTDSNSKTYSVTSVNNSDGTITSTLTPSSGTALTYTTKTVDAKSGDTISDFRPSTDATSSVTNTDGTTTTTTTATAADGTISTTITSTKANTGNNVVYSYTDIYEKTLNDLTLDISTANTNIMASYDSINDSLSIYNKNGGAANLISISGFTGTYTTAAGKSADAATSTTMTNSLFNHLNLGVYDGNKLNTAVTMTDTAPLYAIGAAGSVTIDGKDYTNLTSNKVTAAGVSYTLLTKGTATVTVSQDTDTIIKNVQQFVTDYNKMIDSINDKYYETNYTSGSTTDTDYEPLTDNEKKAMSDSEVTDWEKKAKTGLLYHSTVLNTITSDMRAALSTPVDAVNSDYNTLASVGLTSSTTKGHITLDTDKLKKALAADPDCVYQLFASSTTDTTDTADTGVANRLDTVMKNALSAISDEAGTSATTNDQSYLGKLITSMKSKMTDFQHVMSDYQAKLYKQYNAMEVAISKLNQQQSYVTSAFSSS